MADQLAVDVGLALEVQRRQLVGGDDPRADRGGEVLALGGAETDLHLALLDVAGGPVVDDRVAEDRRLGLIDRGRAQRRADDDADLHLEVQRPAGHRPRDRLARTVEGVRVGEVEVRGVVPRLRDAGRVVDGFPDPFDVGLEGDEVADRRRLVGQQQVSLGERDRLTTQRVGADLQRPLEAELDQLEDRHGQQVRRVAVDHRRTLTQGRDLHGVGRVASAMPLCDTCADRPPSMTSSAPL